MPRQRATIGTHGRITLRGFITDADGRRVPAPPGSRASVWRARTKFRDVDGMTRLVERWASTKNKAENSLKAALVDREAPTNSLGGLRPGTTMSEAGRIWVEQIEYAAISPKTRKQYAEEFERYVIGSAIQGLTLREANNVSTLERFLQDIADTKGNTAAKAARRMLSNMLGMAVRHGALTHNACRDVRQPRAREGSPSALRRARSQLDTNRAFTHDEREWVLAAADGYPEDESEDVADLMAFLAGTGVRISEALECTWWADIDFDATRDDGTSAPSVHIRGTKTEMADRVIPLPPWLASRLKHRARQRGTEGLVFGSPRLLDKTKPRDRRNMIRHIRDRLDSAGACWASSHTFRRTVATWMDEAGFPLAEIANQLGHANVNVTATYLGRRQGSSRAGSVL